MPEYIQEHYKNILYLVFLLRKNPGHSELHRNEFTKIVIGNYSEDTISPRNNNYSCTASIIHSYRPDGDNQAETCSYFIEKKHISYNKQIYVRFFIIFIILLRPLLLHLSLLLLGVGFQQSFCILFTILGQILLRQLS